MNNLITLNDAAERLGVHYMTTYRYVRTGRLAATKDGGQWWVAPDDLAEFEAGAKVEPIPRSEIIPPKLVDRLVTGDENGALQILEGAMTSGATPEEAYVDLLGPAMTIIGERWHNGELSIAEEHLSTTTALRVIGRLGHRAAPRGRTKGTILLAVIANDQHALPTAFVRDLLRFRGFDVRDLGANTPAHSIVETAAKIGNELVAVGLTATPPTALPKMAETVKELASKVNAPIVVGGSFASVDEIANLGDCIPSGSARDALDIFEQIHKDAKAQSA